MIFFLPCPRVTGDFRIRTGAPGFISSSLKKNTGSKEASEPTAPSRSSARFLAASLTFWNTKLADRSARLISFSSAPFAAPLKRDKADEKTEMSCNARASDFIDLDPLRLADLRIGRFGR